MLARGVESPGAWRCRQGAWRRPGKGRCRREGGRRGGRQRQRQRQREGGREPNPAQMAAPAYAASPGKPHQPKPQHPAGTRGSTTPSANLWTVDRDPHHAGAQRGPAGCLGHVWCVRRQRTSRERFCPRVRAALRESVECPWIMSGRQEIKRATICRDHAAWDVGCLSISATQTKLARRRGVNLGRGW